MTVLAHFGGDRFEIAQQDGSGSVDRSRSVCQLDLNCLKFGHLIVSTGDRAARHTAARRSDEVMDRAGSSANCRRRQTGRYMTIDRHGVKSVRVDLASRSPTRRRVGKQQHAIFWNEYVL